MLAAGTIATVHLSKPRHHSYSVMVGEDLQIHRAARVLRERIAAHYPPSLDGIVGRLDDYGSEIEIIVSENSVDLRSYGRDKTPRTMDDWVTVVPRYPQRQ